MKLTVAFFIVSLISANAIFFSPFNRGHERSQSHNETTSAPNAGVSDATEPTPALAPSAVEGEQVWDEDIPLAKEEAFAGFEDMADDFMPLNKEEIIDVGRIPYESLVGQQEIIDLGQIPETLISSGTSLDGGDLAYFGMDAAGSNGLPHPFVDVKPNGAALSESQDWETVQRFLEAHCGFHDPFFIGLGQF